MRLSYRIILNLVITMERRVALKYLATMAGGLITLPAWANGWTKASVFPTQSFLSVAEGDLLATIVDTIIPTTDTPGAKALDVHLFVEKMVTDCYEKPFQDTFKNGLQAVDTMITQQYGRSFLNCDIPQRLSVLMQFQASPNLSEKEFFSTLKSLAIQGYTTSEYVMTKHLNYVMAPGHYHGCVSVPEKVLTQKPSK